MNTEMNIEVEKIANLSAFAVKEAAEETQNEIEEVTENFFQMVREVEAIKKENEAFNNFFDTASDEEVDEMDDEDFDRSLILSALIDEKEGDIQEILADLETTAKREGFKASRLVEYHDGRIEEDYRDTNMYYL